MLIKKDISPDEKKRNMLTILSVFVLLVLISESNYSYAWMKQTDSVKNQFYLPLGYINVEEDFDYDEPVKPNDTVRKKVFFSNTGNMKVFLRVSYDETWKDENNQSMSGTFDHDADSDTAEIDVMDKIWTEFWTGENSETGLKYWWKSDDGYYYYSKVLNGGETTGLILESLLLNQNAPSQYSEGEYNLTFNAESIYFSDYTINNMNTIWNKNITVRGEDIVQWSEN